MPPLPRPPAARFGRGRRLGGDARKPAAGERAGVGIKSASPLRASARGWASSYSAAAATFGALAKAGIFTPAGSPAKPAICVLMPRSRICSSARNIGL